MNFEKKLVILTGKTGRGTALIERNGLGAFVTVNAFSLPDLQTGEYALGVKTPRGVFRREVGSLGRIKSRFALPDGDYDAVHLVLFRTDDEEVVLYGASAEKRLWEGNVMDGLRSNASEKKTTVTQETAAAAAPLAQKIDARYAAMENLYTQEKKEAREIADYFLDIDPHTYYDNALAESNYFAYTGRPAPDPNDYYEQPPAPADTEKEYLRRRFASKTREHTFSAARESASEQATEPKERQQPRASEPPAPDPSEPQSVRIKKASQYTAQQAVTAYKTQPDFFGAASPKLEKLFDTGEKYAPLEKALPGTRWVKVPYDNAGRYYVVGLIGSPADCIAYGVPGTYGAVPRHLDGADFIPLSSQDPTGDGFWVLFQSARTGKLIQK